MRAPPRLTPAPPSGCEPSGWVRADDSHRRTESPRPAPSAAPGWWADPSRGGEMTLVGIDVGGTFTDVTAIDDDRGTVRVTKVPSSPKNEARAVLQGLAELGVEPGDVRRIVHGTT